MIDIIGKDIGLGLDIEPSFSEEALFFGCFLDSDLSGLTFKKISFVGCFFSEDCDLWATKFEEMHFHNCFFIGTVGIHLDSDMQFDSNKHILCNETDANFKVYRDGDFLYQKKEIIFPREMTAMLLAPYRGKEYAYDRMSTIHAHLLKQESIDCTPLIAGLMSKSYPIVQNVVFNFIRQRMKNSNANLEWYEYYMKIFFIWVYDPMVVDEFEFVMEAQNEDTWQGPSFDRIHSSDYYDQTDGLKSIKSIVEHHRKDLLDSKHIVRLKALAQDGVSNSVKNMATEILSLI